MPNRKTAALLHGAYYLRVLDGLNDLYLQGGESQTDSLKKLDVEFPNILSARKNMVDAVSNVEVPQEIGATDRALLDLCNAFPDAGAYLINVKLNSLERVRWLQDALNASLKLRNDVTTQAHLGNLGLAYYELGQLPQAVDHLLRAIQLAEQIGDKYHQGAWLGNLGNTYAIIGDHDKAIEYYEQHLKLSKEINDVRGERHVLANLGVSYAHLGNMPKAIEYYKRFLELAVQSKDRREESQALMNLGFAYYDLGDLEEADRLLQTAQEISIELGDKLTQCLVMGGLADIHIDRKDFQIAIKILTQAIELLKETHNVGAELRLLQSLGNAYTASDDYQNALATCLHVYQLAESIGAKAGMCNALANQISLYRDMGDHASAVRIGRQALDLARQIHSPSNEAFIRWQLALIDEANGENKKAEAEMKAVIEMEGQFGSLDIEKHREHLNNLIQRTDRRATGVL